MTRGSPCSPREPATARHPDADDQESFLQAAAQTRYVLFLIRPDGYQSFYEYRQLVLSRAKESGSSLDHGYEPVNSGFGTCLSPMTETDPMPQTTKHHRSSILVHALDLALLLIVLTIATAGVSWLTTRSEAAIKPRPAADAERRDAAAHCGVRGQGPRTAQPPRPNQDGRRRVAGAIGGRPRSPSRPRRDRSTPRRAQQTLDP